MTSRIVQEAPLRSPPEYPSPHNWTVLVAIADHFQTHHISPTLDELAAQLGLRAASAARAHVLRLAQLGLLTYHRTANRRGIAARSLRLTPAGQSALATYRAMQQANLLRGTVELALTPSQLARARAADLPVDSFPQHTEAKHTILRCLDWYERNYWGEKILKILETKEPKHVQ